MTETEVQALKPGEIIHADESCRPYRVTVRRTIKELPFRHDEAWAVSPSGQIVIRFTCNSIPGFHRASDHERLPKLRPKLRPVKQPAPKRKVKRARRRAA